MKKLLYIVGLFTQALIASQTSLDVHFYVKTHDNNGNVWQTELYFKDKLLENGNLTCNIDDLTLIFEELTRTATSITLRTKIFKKKTLIGQPLLIASWDKKADITSEHADTYHCLGLAVTPHREHIVT